MNLIQITPFLMVLLSCFVAVQLQIPRTRTNNTSRITFTKSRLSVVPLNLTNAPKDVKIAMNQISRGSEEFSFELFQRFTTAILPYNINLIVSPFSVWSLMVLLAEGSSGNTFEQLKKVLRLPSDLTYVRSAYKSFQHSLTVNTTTIELAVNQAFFSDINRPIDIAYEHILESDYEADHLAVNFHVPQLAVKTINDYVKQQTKGKVEEIVKDTDLQDAQLLLTSAIYFKGQWKFPFNVSLTTEQQFYWEDGTTIDTVNMMYQRNAFPIAMIADLEATVLELPYGKEDRLCMLLLLPRKGIYLSTTLNKLSTFSIDSISAELHKYDNIEEVEELEVDVYLPRFTISSDFELSPILESMGITDLFHGDVANLTKISKQSTYVSRVIHKAIIEVNEIGTVAAAATGGTVSFKQTPVEFNANRPFGFLIIDRVTSTLLFSGQVRRPGKF